MAAKQPSAASLPIWCLTHCTFLISPPVAHPSTLCFPRPPAPPAVPYQLASRCTFSPWLLETPKLLEEESRVMMKIKKKKKKIGLRQGRQDTFLLDYQLLLRQTEALLKGLAPLHLNSEKSWLYLHMACLAQCEWAEERESLTSFLPLIG